MAIREKEMKNPSYSDRPGPPDFMSRFLAAHSSTPDKMTKMDLFTICQSNIGAGSDTTAITLSACLYYLLRHSSSLSRLRTELEEAEREGRISRPITFKEAQELPYLQAVIRETLRLHPATGLPLLRVVPSLPSFTVNGHVLPVGAEVGINAWVAHRNTDVYGLDAEEWRPERWIKIDDEDRGGEIEKYFFAFGMGSRTCIGKNISLLEIQKVVPEIIRSFDLSYGSDGEWDTSNHWFVKMTGFKVGVNVLRAPAQ